MKPIYISSGEPAGIGPDICLALAGYPCSHVLVILANSALMAARAKQLGLAVKLLDYAGQTTPAPVGSLYIHSIPLGAAVVAGQLNVTNAHYVLTLLHTAAELAMSGAAAAIVTAPVQKSIINEAGQGFTGHTEFFQFYAGVSRVVMMLATPTLRVALATTHLPLRAVADAINKDLLTDVIAILETDLRQKFAIPSPRILVCGLNPHAGEQGHLGVEEIDIIEPVLKTFRDNGLHISQPLPADTLFTEKYLANADAVLAMYHDQGLPVLKSKGFGDAVNVTLGLPFIRTSVDHGTALDLAGTGKANASSLKAAVTMAIELSVRQLTLTAS